ncbi:MAG: chloride channel protein [Leeuwenhoekiella sp.]
MPHGNRSFIRKLNIWRQRNASREYFVYIMSICTGLLSGLAAVAIKNLTFLIQDFLEGNLVSDYSFGFYFLFPILGLLLTWVMITFVLRRPVPQGISHTLRAISKRKGIFKRFQTFASVVTAPFTVGFGGSVGLESPTVITGAALSANLASFFRLDQATRTLLIGCAAAGAMACIFKAPVAAIIFAVEVFSLDLTLVSLLPLLLASLAAVLTSYFFFGSETLLPFTLSDVFVIADFPYYILLGIFSGLVSVYFNWVYFGVLNFYKENIKSGISRLFLSGSLLGLLIYLIPPLYGEGYDLINLLLQGDVLGALGETFFNNFLDNIWVVIGLLAGLVIFKVFATAITMAGGGIGGIFAPVLFMGSAMGNCFAKIINALGFEVSESNFTLVGMTGLMAGVLHAPLTAIFLIAELTGGYGLFVPLMVTAAISYGINHSFMPHSVYARELAQRGELLTHDKDQAVLTLLDLRSVIETNFVIIRPEMTLGQMVKDAVAQSKRNLFPVVDNNGILLGVITLDDIREIMFDATLYEKTLVTDLMHAAPDYIFLDKDSSKQVMKKFQDSGAWNLPVIQDEKYIGFISKSKLLTAYRTELLRFSRNF